MSKFSRVRAVPWLMLFEAVKLARSHLMDSTSPADRRRVVELVKRSKGMPQNLSARERDDLKRIASKIDASKLAAAAAPAFMGAVRGRRFR